MQNIYTFSNCDDRIKVLVDIYEGGVQVTEISYNDFADIARIMANPEATDELVMNAIGEAQI